MRAVRRSSGLLACVRVASMAQAGSGDVKLPGGAFSSVLKYEDNGSRVRVAPFTLMSLPVTNADFLAFVRAHPQWRRDAVPSVFAE